MSDSRLTLLGKLSALRTEVRGATDGLKLACREMQLAQAALEAAREYSAPSFPRPASRSGAPSRPALSLVVDNDNATE